MIQAHEFRIGNAVYCKYRHGHYLVTEINETDIRIKEPEREYKFWESFETVIPIALSAEILQACGNLEGRCFYFKEQGAVKFIMWQDQVDNSYHYNNGNNNIIVESLHQLQNLFFALTGTELPINLEKVKV